MTVHAGDKENTPPRLVLVVVEREVAARTAIVAGVVESILSPRKSEMDALVGGLSRDRGAITRVFIFPG